MSEKRDAFPPPIQMRKLLVAVDASDAAQEAARAGLELGSRFGARVEFVHAVGSPALSWRSEEDARTVSRGEDVLTAARERVVDLVTRAAGAHRGVALDTQERVRVGTGNPATVIIECARAMPADLIVLGRLRTRGVFDFGSTARAVLAKSPCAVWSQPGAPKDVKRILVPFDFSTEAEIALATALSFAQTFGAKLTVMHCLEPLLYGDDPWGSLSAITTIQELEHSRSSAFETEMERVPWNSVEHDSTFVTGVAAERIAELSSEFDLVVMGTHGRTGLSAAVLGSVAYSVLKRATVPVLTVRSTARTFRFA